MTERRESPTLTDYLLIGINPTLIMFLVGSLVFFLLEALYQGQYDTRLQFIFGLFVMAIVCIARISINEGTGHAILFAIPLALVTGLAMSRFVEYAGPMAQFKTLLNWSMMGLVWWAAHQLTWDCTVIDEAADASGQGLLQQLGWKQNATTTPTGTTAIEEPEGLSSHDEPPPPKPAGFTSVLRQWLMRKHTPGVWVVYFSLAALPIFGFGQGLIGSTDAASQSSAQRLLAIYVGSGLALLVSTSFLNLRRYLRKRHVDISFQLTFNWLAVGGLLILAVSIVAWILPGPRAAQWANPVALSRNLNPSKWGWGNDGPKGGQNAGQQSGGQQSGGQQSGGQQSGGQQSGGQQSGGQQSGGQQSGGQQSGGQQSGGQQSAQSNQTQSASNTSSGASSGGSSPTQMLTSALSGLGWLVRIVALVVFLAALWFFRDSLLRALRGFLDGLRAWWAGLFGGSQAASAGEAAKAAEAELLKPPPAWREFVNPFATGLAARVQPGELIRYTFAALDAWGRESGQPRGIQETPLEFARRLGAIDESFGRDAQAVAELYGQLAFAREALPANAASAAERLWQRLAISPAAPTHV